MYKILEEPCFVSFLFISKHLIFASYNIEMQNIENSITTFKSYIEFVKGTSGGGTRISEGWSIIQLFKNVMYLNVTFTRYRQCQLKGELAMKSTKVCQHEKHELHTQYYGPHSWTPISCPS